LKIFLARKLAGECSAAARGAVPERAAVL